MDASIPYERGPLYPDSMFYSPAAIGARVTIQSVAGRAFDENETYSLAVSSFLAEGGDTYHAFREASEAAEPVTIGFDYGAFAQYLLEGCDGVVPDEYAEPQGRITVVGA